METNCFICDKHKGIIKTAGIPIYENEYVYVGHIDRKGKGSYLGHLMIDLKRHIPTLAEMTNDEAKAFGLIISRVSKALKETENAEHIYALVSGNSVPHLHLHLIARYPNTPERYWGPTELYDWPEAPIANEEEMSSLCKKIKNYLANEVFEEA
ncbi:HIT family protein [Niallia circulans]|jgi:histidine triad (HIT) family protein|uniref:HIT family protein n=1 Tax=Niallia circulans TaxID=1397 RepID=UPI00203B3BD8|nr:HIT family protein [Niallia circulans]MCM2980371.1 HIT family protein [Niallia circulans]